MAKGQESALPKSENSQNNIVALVNNMTESTVFRSPEVPDSYWAPYNPDPIWQKNSSYKTYENMLKDDQVNVCLRLKKDLVLGGGGLFIAEDEGQEEMIEDLGKAFFEDYEGDFHESLTQVLSSYEFGLSITEKIFQLREEGKLGLKVLKTRHPNSFKIYQDEYGNITDFKQNTERKGEVPIKRTSLTHYINDSRFQNPYGTSDLQAAYNAWFIKSEIVKYMAIFMEKAASPTPVARYDKNAPQTAVNKIFDIIKRFQTKTAITIPKDIEVEFLEAKNNGEVFVKAINLFNMFIGRSLFIPDLVGFTGGETGGGSYTLGKEQMNLFFMHITRRRSALEAIINKEYVWPIIQYNYGFIPNYPKWRFKPLDDMKAIEMAKVWLDAVKGKTFQANPEEVNYFRKLVKFPEGEVIQPQTAQVDPVTGRPIDPLTGKPEEEDPNNPNPENPDEIEEDDSKEPEDSPPGFKGGKGKPKKEAPEKYKLKMEGDYHKKVDFKAIKTKLVDYDNSVMNDLRPFVQKSINDLIDQVEKKKIIQNQNLDRIDSLSMKYKKDMQLILKKSFTELYQDAQSQAQNEILKSNFAKKKPLASDKFLEVIENETFKFIGDYEYTILKRTRAELIAAIKDGKPLSSVKGVLDTELEELSEVQMERFARTKHTEVLNNGRVEFFQDSGVVAGYQYSAILDDVTSDICSGLHNKKFVAGTEPIPPMHFNCRSLLIPITKYEEFNPTETIRGLPVSEFIEENKGAGFATK